jgi:hypothetical protein
MNNKTISTPKPPKPDNPHGTPFPNPPTLPLPPLR